MAIPFSILLVLLGVYLPQSVVLARHDGAEHRLPNRNVALLTVTTFVCVLVAAVFDPDIARALRPSLGLAVLAGAGAILLALLAPALIGMGDAKTVFVVVLLALLCGGPVLIAGALASCLLAAVAGALVLAAARDRTVRIPVGPMLLAMPFLGLLGAPLVSSALGAV